ncbi:serine O-acetyltransferase [Carboxylicivirga marina]
MKMLFDPTLCICLNYRISQFWSRHKMLFISKFFWALNFFVFHVDLDPRSDLAGGCLFIHPIGIVVGANVRSKGYLKIYQGATLGGSFDNVLEIDGTTVSQPVIGDYTLIGPGAKVLGPLKIISYSIVGANSVVTKSPKVNGLILGSQTIQNHEYLKEFDKWPKH